VSVHQPTTADGALGQVRAHHDLGARKTSSTREARRKAGVEHNGKTSASVVPNSASRLSLIAVAKLSDTFEGLLENVRVGQRHCGLTRHFDRGRGGHAVRECRRTTGAGKPPCRKIGAPNPKKMSTAATISASALASEHELLLIARDCGGESCERLIDSRGGRIGELGLLLRVRIPDGARTTSADPIGIGAPAAADRDAPTRANR
jgi:hypothetical protein